MFLHGNHRNVAAIYHDKTPDLDGGAPRLLYVELPWCSAENMLEPVGVLSVKDKSRRLLTVDGKNLLYLGTEECKLGRDAEDMPTIRPVLTRESIQEKTMDGSQTAKKPYDYFKDCCWHRCT